MCGAGPAKRSVVCALGVIRLGTVRASLPAAILGTVALACAVAALVQARTRHRSVVASLEAGRPVGTFGPTAIGAVSVSVLGLAALGLLVL